MRPLPCFSTKVYHDTSILSHILRLQALPTQTCMGSQHRQHPCFPTSCHLQRRHHRQQTANRFKWSRCWEVAVLTMLVTHTPTGVRVIFLIPKSAMCTINRHLRVSGLFVKSHHCAPTSRMRAISVLCIAAPYGHASSRASCAPSYEGRE